ncbi:hypothetical protein SLS62_006657 [Diatrype stigma]|uniref:Rhodopsin domain-containing protein n=1 Tax=Diatrype stigma TaxID=117547 RepID=A0AAN9YNX4_9PEZI
MEMEGDGLMAIKLLWGLLAMTMIVVSLRVYTRIFVVHSYGADDNVYNLAFVSDPVASTFSETPDEAHAQWLLYLANNVGGCLCVCSQLFLLLYTVSITVSARFGFGQDTMDVAEGDRAKAMLWELIGQTCAILGTAIAKVSLGLFLQRLVTGLAIKAALWAAMGILIGASISTCFVLWLQVGTGLTSSPEEETVGLIVWTAAEMAVTLFCIGIPASRSLCKQFRDRLVSEHNSDYKKKVQQLYGLRRTSGSQGQGARRLEEGDNIDARPRRVQCYNKSDEQVLLEPPASGQDAGIRITEEFRVTRT